MSGPRLNGIVRLDAAATENNVKQPLTISEHVEETTKVSPCNNLRLFFTLTIGSIGIIFGDIGTSPLYVLHTVFAENPNTNTMNNV